MYSTDYMYGTDYVYSTDYVYGTRCCYLQYVRVVTVSAQSLQTVYNQYKRVLIDHTIKLLYIIL